MTHLLLLLLTTVGLTLLCLARERHQRDLIGRRLSQGTARRARYGGTLALLVAYSVAAKCLGWAHGTLEWVALLSVAAVLVMMALAVRLARRSTSR